MTRRTLTILLALSAAVTSYQARYACSASGKEFRVIGFEDLYTGEKGDGIKIPDGYEGFNWSNKFRCITKDRHPNSGYQRGCIGNLCAYTSGQKDISMTSTNGQSFDFRGAYITAAWRENQDFMVEGWKQGRLIYSETLVTDTNGPWWFEFEFNDIDTLWFRPGTRASTGCKRHLAIDEITVCP